MRLLYISQGNIPSRWAHTVQAMKMAEALAPLAADFRLVTQAHWASLLRRRFDFEGWYGIRRPFRIVRLPAILGSAEAVSRNVYDRRFDRLAAWYASRQKPDYVYTRSPNAGRRCIKHGLRTIIETHSDETSSTTGIIQRLGAHPLLAALVTVTQALKDTYVRLGIPRAKVIVWPDAVDPESFCPDLNREQARQQLGLPRGKPLAMYLGHLYEHKGVDLLVDAARWMPDVNFVIVGGWPEDVHRLRSRSGGQENVLLRDFVPNVEVPLYLAAADILVLPNSGRFPQASTTSPLKLFEYMASRRAILATAIPALDGVLQPERNALIVTPDSTDALVTGVRRLVADPALRERLAVEAWTRVRSFTWDERARAIVRFVVTGSKPEP